MAAETSNAHHMCRWTNLDKLYMQMSRAQGLQRVRDVVMKCKCKKICRKSESILSFSYENTVTEEENMGPVKACAPR